MDNLIIILFIIWFALMWIMPFVIIELELRYEYRDVIEAKKKDKGKTK